MKRYIPLYIFLIFLISSASFAKKEHSIFHPPQTEAEKALDKIVGIATSQPNMFQIILQNPKYDLSKTKELETLFSAFFLYKWRAFEKNMVNQYCGGKYQPDKKCGYDINPVSCPINGKSPYFYRTVIGDEKEAIVSLATSNDMTDNGVYYMRYEDGTWKMAGLYCEMDIPDTTPSKALVKKFLQPKLESEKKLESILQAARTDKDIIPFIFNLIWRDQSKDSIFPLIYACFAGRLASACTRYYST